MKKILAIVLFGIGSVVFAADPASETADSATDSMAQEDPAQSTGQSAETSTSAEPMDTQDEATSTISADQQAAPVEEQAGFSRGSVVRSIFTTGVEDREPVDKLNNTKAEQEQVFYFTELRDMSGQTAIHRWEKDGEVRAEVKFDVRGPRWRVWSSKNFAPTSEGEWKVSVINGAGEVIAEESLNLKGIPQKPMEETGVEQPAAETSEEPASETPEPPVNEQLLQ